MLLDAVRFCIKPGTFFIGGLIRLRAVALFFLVTGVLS